MIPHQLHRLIDQPFPVLRPAPLYSERSFHITRCFVFSDMFASIVRVTPYFDATYGFHSHPFPSPGNNNFDAIRETQDALDILDAVERAAHIPVRLSSPE